MRSGASGQLEQILQLGERPRAAVVVGRAAHAMPRELLAGVASHRLEQRPLVTSLRDADLHREPRRWHSHSSYVPTSSGSYGTSTCFGHAGRRFVAVQRLEDAVDQPARRELLDLVEHEALAPDHPALAHEEHLHRRLEIVVGDADHVDVLVLVGDHLLLGDRLLHGDQAIA